MSGYHFNTFCDWYDAALPPGRAFIPGGSISTAPYYLEVAPSAPNDEVAVEVCPCRADSVSPTAGVFPSTSTGHTSPPITLSVTNNAGVPHDITVAGLGGAQPSAFRISGTSCNGWIPARATCQVSVVFAPTSMGSFSAALSIADSTPASPRLVVPLAGQGVGGASPPAANLLTSASFEGGHVDGWHLTPGANWAVYSNSTPGVQPAKDGHWFLETNTGSVCSSTPSVYQDVSVSAAAGQSYTLSMWVRSPAAGSTFSGELVLWALGGTQEASDIHFTATNTWQLITAPLDVRQSGHTKFRAQIYEHTCGTNLDIDGAQLLNDGLSSASFEGGHVDGWHLTPGANWAVYSNSTPGVQPAKDGHWFLETNTGSVCSSTPSVYQDVSVSAAAGQSYTLSMWVRSPAAGSTFSGELVLWALGGTQEASDIHFTATNTWQLITAPLDVRQSGHTKFRAQIYEHTCGTNLDIDGAQLLNDGLSSASFEGGHVDGWHLTPGANWAVYSNSTPGVQPAKDGHWFLETNTGSVCSSTPSVYQDVSVSAAAGQSYTLSMWVRSPAAGSTFSGELVLWALGGTQEASDIHFTATNTWQLITAPLDVRQSGHTKFRAQIYEHTCGTNLDIDGVGVFGNGNVRSGT